MSAKELRDAARLGDLPRLQAMLAAGAAVDAADEEGSTALRRAAYKGHASCVQALLAAGAAVAAANKQGRTALHWAAHNGHDMCVGALLAAEAAVDTADKEGSTALHLAAYNGYAICVQALLAAGSTVDAADKDGLTALQCATLNGHASCVQLLQAAKATAEEGRQDDNTAAMQVDGPSPRGSSGEAAAKPRRQLPRKARPPAIALRDPSPSLSAGLSGLNLDDAGGAASQGLGGAATASQCTKRSSETSGELATLDPAALQQHLAQPLAQLLEAGWQSHTLDNVFLRVAGLAAKQVASLRQHEACLAVEAGCLGGYGAQHDGQHAHWMAADAERAGAAASQLEAAWQAALRMYYQSQDGAAALAAACGANGASGSSHASSAGWLAHLSAAVQRSLQKHPAPSTSAELEAMAPAPPLCMQFAPLSSGRLLALGLQRSSDASGLSEHTRSQLREVPAGPDLPEAHADLLRSGKPHGTVLCEIKWRLHRVRLLTPPDMTAHSSNATPEGDRPSKDDGVGVYVGRMYDFDPEQPQESKYIYEVKPHEVGPEKERGEYSGPALAIDGEEWRNETAFINCVFGSGRRPNVQAQPIWDPIDRLPHMLLKYCGAKQAQLLEELLLFYRGVYWTADLLATMLEGHREFAARAKEAIAALLAALEAAGAPLADIVACLAPVDLTSHEHCFYRRAAGWTQQGPGGNEDEEEEEEAVVQRKPKRRR